MNEIKNKKGDTVKVVLITLLVVLLVGCISFIVYDKFIKKDNKENNPQTAEKDNSVTDENKITFKGIQNDGDVSRKIFETNKGYVEVKTEDSKLNILFYSSDLKITSEGRYDDTTVNDYLLNTIKVDYDSCVTESENEWCSNGDKIVVHDNIITLSYSKYIGETSESTYYLKSVDLDGNSIFEVEIPANIFKIDYKDGLYYVFDSNLIWKTYDTKGNLKNNNVYETKTYMLEEKTEDKQTIVALNNDNTFYMLETYFAWIDAFSGTYETSKNYLTLKNFSVLIDGNLHESDIKNLKTKTMKATLKDDSLIINGKEYKLLNK